MFNWGKTVIYNKNIINADNLNELIKIAKKNKYTILGGGHSFIDIYGGGPLVNIRKLNKIFKDDEKSVKMRMGMPIKECKDVRMKEY